MLGVEGRRKEVLLLFFRKALGARRLRRRLALMIESKRGTEGSAVGEVGCARVRM